MCGEQTIETESTLQSIEHVGLQQCVPNLHMLSFMVTDKNQINIAHS